MNLKRLLIPASLTVVSLTLMALVAHAQAPAQRPMPPPPMPPGPSFPQRPGGDINQVRCDTYSGRLTYSAVGRDQREVRNQVVWQCRNDRRTFAGDCDRNVLCYNNLNDRDRRDGRDDRYDDRDRRDGRDDRYDDRDRRDGRDNRYDDRDRRDGRDDRYDDRDRRDGRDTNRYLKCDTFSNGYKFYREGDATWAQQEVLKECRMNRFTAPVECDRNLRCY